MKEAQSKPRTVVFGSLDNATRHSSIIDNSSSSSSSGSNDSKQNPLLANTNGNGKGKGNGRSSNRRQLRKSYYSRGENKYYQEPSDGATFCRCIGTMVLLFLPLVAMTLMLAFLSILVVFDKENLQEFEFEDGSYNTLANATDIAGMYYASVRSDSISVVLSQYEPYAHVLGLSSTACVLISMVTVARNIQIEVYQKRTGSYMFMKFINYLAAIINVVAYIGLMIAVNFRANQESPEWAPKAHYFGFMVFFVGTATYTVLHQFLLWRQAEYPVFVKILFFGLAVTIVGSSVLFGMPLWYNDLASDESGEPIHEWIAVFASAISIGLYVVLFFIDPADDQVTNFFCGTLGVARRSGGSGGKAVPGNSGGPYAKQSGGKKQMRRGNQPMMMQQVPGEAPRLVAYNMQQLDTNLYRI